MFEYFPGNYTWSAAFHLALMAGGELGELHRGLAELRDKGDDVDDHDWAEAWAQMAFQQENLAGDDLRRGYAISASRRLLRAAVYHASGERQLPPGPAKAESYSAMVQAFAGALDCGTEQVERVEFDSPDGPLPGYLIPAAGDGPAPVVVFFGGFDTNKELLYCSIGDAFRRRGISCVAVDSPGVGEPLRLRNVASRPDYEVPAGAIIDGLELRSDVDADRIGVLGLSLGGYYAPRAAVFEPRIAAVAAWGGIWDWGATWARRWETRTRDVSVPFFQLPWVMGTATMEEALERVKQWSLVDVLPQMTQPFLMIHGEDDRQIPLADGIAAYKAAGSVDKELRVFTEEEGGAAHCQLDEPDPARQHIADWFRAQFRL